MIFYIIIILLLIQLLLIIRYSTNFIYRNFLIKEQDLECIYGKNTWVLITGCSSGQGKLMAIEFAKRNFNIILMGRKNIKNVEQLIRAKYQVKTIALVTDFCKAYRKKYFDRIKNRLDTVPGELSILVNNIGHRTAWNPYHSMPAQKINDTIICGTIVQARLTQLAIQYFVKRNKKSCIINITAMCSYSNFWFGLTSEISVPYLSVYEASNSFGYYHSNSIQKEYAGVIDVLNITPGAVLTENTRSMLKDVIFSVEADIYVKNIFKLIGNYTGPQYAYWGHELSSILCNIYLNPELLKVGKIISEAYMRMHISSNS